MSGRMWSVEVRDDVAVLTATGPEAICRSCNFFCCGCWARELADLCRPLSARVVVLDLSRIDSPRVEMLDAAAREHREAGRRGAECRVCAAPGTRALFALTRLDQFVRVYPDRASAVAGIQCQPGATFPVAEPGAAAGGGDL